MDLAWIEHLVNLMEKADLSEVEIDDSAKGVRVHLKRGSEPSAPQPAPVVQLTSGAAAAPPAPLAAVPAGPAPVEAGPGEAALEEAGDSDTVPFLSPMVGTFYRATQPEAEPFVTVGTNISEETVICIVEAMKVMNEIKAETRGEITSVLVDNGEPVEFGQPLFLIRPG